MQKSRGKRGQVVSKARTSWNVYIDDVRHYYQESQWLYRAFCYSKETLGMHFGFWDKGTKTRQDAILCENNEIIRRTGIHGGMRVLDAGCGVGGTALYIARKTHARVIGITIDPHQKALAERYAREKHLSDLVTFEVQDYTGTTFPLHSFDVVYGIESICYASPKKLFLKEAYRLLKPGGKLVMLDGYQSRKAKNQDEQVFLNDFVDAFALKDLTMPQDLARDMKETGFVRVRWKNENEKVLPSVRHFSRLVGTLWPLIWVLRKLVHTDVTEALKRNAVALRLASTFYEKRLAAYCVHYGEKPEKNVTLPQP